MPIDRALLMLRPHWWTASAALCDMHPTGAARSLNPHTTELKRKCSTVTSQIWVARLQKAHIPSTQACPGDKFSWAGTKASKLSVQQTLMSGSITSQHLNLLVTIIQRTVVGL